MPSDPSADGVPTQQEGALVGGRICPICDETYPPDPSAAATTRSCSRASCSPRPDRPRSSCPGSTPRIEAVVLTALRKLPRNRYPAMEDFLEDIERLLGERDGELSAGSIREPDVYEPRSPYARSIAAIFYRKLGLEPPQWQ